ncbi:MAG: hypothetical protein GDA56_11450 [Hormoscilla sp. GM7CHS1pb]|nr:hypothetical protein [Hormoscilla sp. GM7CHS1pb]
MVVCPVLLDEDRRVFEYNGIPQFHPIAYKTVSGKLYLKQDNVLFCEVERNKKGKYCSPLLVNPCLSNPYSLGWTE